MSRARHPLALAVAALGIALAATACGAGAASAPTVATPAANAPATQSAPPAPEIAEPAVAPVPSDSAALATFGQRDVESGYRELVDLATRLAFDKDDFLADGNNTSADLDQVLAGRTYVSQTDFVRKQADACSKDDDKACLDVMAFTYYDFSGGDGHTLTYRTDGPFVAEQSVSNPTVSAEKIEGQDALRFTFVHSAKVRLVLDGKPITVTMDRDLTYHLWPADHGNPQPWWIVNWHVVYRPVITDDASGQPVKL